MRLWTRLQRHCSPRMISSSKSIKAPCDLGYNARLPNLDELQVKTHANNQRILPGRFAFSLMGLREPGA